MEAESAHLNIHKNGSPVYPAKQFRSYTVSSSPNIRSAGQSRLELPRQGPGLSGRPEDRVPLGPARSRSWAHRFARTAAPHLCASHGPVQAAGPPNQRCAPPTLGDAAHRRGYGPVAPTTVDRICQCHRLNHHGSLQPAEWPRCYKHEVHGNLRQLDIKRLAPFSPLRTCPWRCAITPVWGHHPPRAHRQGPLLPFQGLRQGLSGTRCMPALTKPHRRRPNGKTEHFTHPVQIEWVYASCYKNTHKPAAHLDGSMSTTGSASTMSGQHEPPISVLEPSEGKLMRLHT